ncbi:hypothetical protein F4805DRAFT_111689 [Annulohypoxylon moriforme]|nr:hypothetical protein F4805DRAFT_111689 [Annulohypoxylon moriforme]
MDQFEEPPPPYPREPNTASSTNQPQRMEPWQRRWNREWFKHAFVKDLRRSYSYDPLPIKRTAKREKIKSSRALAAAYINEAIQSGVADEEDSLSVSRWHRITDRFFWYIKQEYEEFLEWRRDRKNEKKLWKFTAVMEDTGDDPKWKGEMTLKISQKHLSEFVREGRWIDFPSTENIKWFWVTRPHPGHDHEYLAAPANGNWMPDPYLQEITMPFGESRQGVTRNPPLNIFGAGHWHSFVGRGDRGNICQCTQCQRPNSLENVREAPR